MVRIDNLCIVVRMECHGYTVVDQHCVWVLISGLGLVGQSPNESHGLKEMKINITCVGRSKMG